MAGWTARTKLMALCVMAIVSPQGCTGFGAGDAARGSYMTFAIIKPDAVSKGSTAAIQNKIAAAGFSISSQRMGVIEEQLVRTLYSEHQLKPFFGELVAFMTSNPSVVMILTKPSGGAVETWRRLIGPTDPGAARAQQPMSLRALFGTDVTRNGLHGSETPAAALRELSIFHDYLKKPKRPRGRGLPGGSAAGASPLGGAGAGERECSWDDAECMAGAGGDGGAGRGVVDEAGLPEIKLGRSGRTIGGGGGQVVGEEMDREKRHDEL